MDPMCSVYVGAMEPTPKRGHVLHIEKMSWQAEINCESTTEMNGNWV